MTYDNTYNGECNECMSEEWRIKCDNETNQVVAIECAACGSVKDFEPEWVH